MNNRYNWEYTKLGKHRDSIVAKTRVNCKDQITDVESATQYYHDVKDNGADVTMRKLMN